MVTSVSSAAPASANSSATARSSLVQNFDTFLTLLTAQLQNQDPLDPLDSNQFTEQLVQFSQVEQQITTNERLSDLAALQKSSALGAASVYLGREADITGDTATLTDTARWRYRLDAPAEAVTLRVRDSAGRLVFETRGELAKGVHDFSWNGRSGSGASLPPGSYRLSVEAMGADGNAVRTSTSTRERVIAIDLGASEPSIQTASGAKPLTAVLSIYE
jgi:flagellar basal-body rod modification protein FlgD